MTGDDVGRVDGLVEEPAANRHSSKNPISSSRCGSSSCRLCLLGHHVAGCCQRDERDRHSDYRDGPEGQAGQHGGGQERDGQRHRERAELVRDVFAAPPGHDRRPASAQRSPAAPARPTPVLREACHCDNPTVGHRRRDTCHLCCRSGRSAWIARRMRSDRSGTASAEATRERPATACHCRCQSAHPEQSARCRRTAASSTPGSSPSSSADKASRTSMHVTGAQSEPPRSWFPAIFSTSPGTAAPLVPTRPP